ncbi:hypothetical protein C8R43DRAFT_901487, partial [Mycena crocata]
MDPSQWLPCPCSVCAQTVRKKDITLQDPYDFNLQLLRNDNLPSKCLPTTYNFQAYDKAILYHKALTVTDKLGPIWVCSSCLKSLDKGKQPVNSIANFQYYARDELPDAVKVAFNDCSMFDKMLISRARSTKITHLYSNNRESTEYGKPTATSQRYSQGNVAIFAQDIPSVRHLLPPDINEIHEAMCALFVGANTVPSKENIKKLSPVLVSKNRVSKLIDFLLQENSFYISAGIEFSKANLDALFADDDASDDTGTLRGVEMRCLPNGDGAATATSSYAERGDPIAENDQVAQPLPNGQRTDVVMEAVGYTIGERTPLDYDRMKASALAWCLDKKQYIQMRSSSKFISDRDPGLLTYHFPHLDPWGIGSFHEPLR